MTEQSHTCTTCTTTPHQPWWRRIPFPQTKMLLCQGTFHSRGMHTSVVELGHNYYPAVTAVPLWLSCDKNCSHLHDATFLTQQLLRFICCLEVIKAYHVGQPSTVYRQAAGWTDVVCLNLILLQFWYICTYQHAFLVALIALLWRQHLISATQALPKNIEQ